MEALDGAMSLDTNYTHVGALFISWAPSAADSPDKAAELKRMKSQSVSLSKLFRRGYNIAVDEYDIPRERPFRALTDKLWDVRDAYEKPRHFLIIYYGGHGGSDQNRNAIWKWCVIVIRCFHNSPQTDSSLRQLQLCRLASSRLDQSATHLSRIRIYARRAHDH